MALVGVVPLLTAAELAREPRDLGVIAYFDGYAAGGGHLRNQTFPRPLTRAEEVSWREGFAEGRTERVCHSWHGFIPCAKDHPLVVNPEPFRGFRSTPKELR